MNYQDFKNSIIAFAEKKGLKEYELYYTEEQSISAGALMHEINEFSTTTAAGACFRCIFEGKMGYASTELFTEEEAERVVDAAVDNAIAIESEDMVFIHEAGDTYQWPEQVKTTEPDAAQLTRTALDLLEKIYQKDTRVVDGSQSGVGFCNLRVALYNSKGLDLDYRYDYSQMLAAAVVKEGEKMYSAYTVKDGDFAQFNLEETAGQVVIKAVENIGEDSVPSGVYQVALSKGVMASLLSTYFEVFSAEQAQRGLSLLADREGTKVASDMVTIWDDPFCAETMMHMPFDGEGVATSGKKVIENGTLNTLLHNLATAHKAGIKSTGNGRKAGYASPVSVLPYNFYVAKGKDGNKEAIFEKIQEGIYVTELNGLHAGANPVTGDFSLAAEGFLVTGGRKAQAVKNFTVSGNFFTLLQNIVMVGDDLEFDSANGGCCFGSPTVVVKDISVAGK